MSDKQVADVARRLAHALGCWAYSRQPQDLEIVNKITTELCQLVAREEFGQMEESSEQQTSPDNA